MCAIVKKSISNTCIWSVGNMCAWQWSVQVTHNWCCTARRERRWIGGSADRRIGGSVCMLMFVSCGVRSSEFGVVFGRPRRCCHDSSARSCSHSRSRSRSSGQRQCDVISEFYRRLLLVYVATDGNYCFLSFDSNWFFLCLQMILSNW